MVGKADDISVAHGVDLGQVGQIAFQQSTVSDDLELSCIAFGDENVPIALKSHVERICQSGLNRRNQDLVNL